MKAQVRRRIPVDHTPLVTAPGRSWTSSAKQRSAPTPGARADRRAIRFPVGENRRPRIEPAGDRTSHQQPVGFIPKVTISKEDHRWLPITYRTADVDGLKIFYREAGAAGCAEALAAARLSRARATCSAT